MIEVFCVHTGDCIECGCSLHSIHSSLEKAVAMAEFEIALRDEHWKDEDDHADWEYVEILANENNFSENFVKCWKTRKGYDIVAITKEIVDREL